MNLWRPSLLLWLLICLKEVLGSDYVNEPIRVGAWNLQRLGSTKMGKSEVVEIIVEVMRRYDIIVALEVVDASGEAPLSLLSALNDGLTDTYELTISERLGRTRYKEQYAFYWKSSRVTATSTFQYDDSIKDTFQFEPFAVVFEGSFDSSLPSFAVISIHTKPSDAENEIDGLVDVYDDFKMKTGIQDAMILGDFNAGCTYVTGGDYANIRLWTDSRFTWLVSDHIDTTVKGTSCPYDRIVVAGSKMLEVTYGGSAQPYYFDEEMDISNDDLTESVSDHYPIEVLVRGAVSESARQSVTPAVVVSVIISATPEAITALSSSLEARQETCPTSQDLVMVTWTVNSKAYALESLEAYSDAHPNVLSKEAVAVIQYKVNNGGLADPSLYGETTSTDSYTVTLLCQKSQASCTVSVATPTSIN